MSLMEPWKDQRRIRRFRIWLLAITAALYVAFIGAFLWFRRAHLDSGEVPWLLGSMAVVGLFLALALWLTIRGFGETPAAYLKLRRDREQWSRMHSCLFAVPVMSTLVTANGLNLVHNGLKGEGGFVTGVLILMFAMAAPVFLLVLIEGGRKGEPGTPERRMWERMNDELSRQHAGLAYRLGFCVALAALGAVLVAALFAPKALIYVLLVGAWAATVSTSVRFGLLQRSAEPPLDEA